MRPRDVASKWVKLLPWVYHERRTPARSNLPIPDDEKAVEATTKNGSRGDSKVSADRKAGKPYVYVSLDKKKCPSGHERKTAKRV